MARIKITQKQALMLENLNKPKVLRVTESQYNAILKYEGLDENAIIPQMYNAIKHADSKEGSQFIANVNRETKNKGVFHESEDMWKEFVNELYGLNESGNNLYEKLIKLMEACGYVENRKLSKSKFDNNKDMVKEVILSGLNKLQECGSPYMAMEHMENEYDRIKNSLKQQLNQEPTNQFTDDEKRDEIERKRALELIRRREAGESESVNEEDFENNEESANGIVGLDILNYEPFSNLPETRDDMGDYKVRMELKLPSLSTADASVIMFSKEDFIDHTVEGPKSTHNFSGYVSMFKNKFGEEPIFVNLKPGRFGSADIANEKYLEWKESGNADKQAWLDRERNSGNNSGLDEIEVDETTSMGGAGAVFGNNGGDFPVGKLEMAESVTNEIINDLGLTNKISDTIYEALEVLKKKVEEESEEPIEEQGIGSVGAYDTPGFAPSEFMGTAGKKGKAPVNKGITHNKTMIPGGKFVAESAQDETQWAGGEFVEFDDCTKLNNNKEAQKGGCSTGSIDNVVKLKKTTGNVNAPSLGKKQG